MAGVSRFLQVNFLPSICLNVHIEVVDESFSVCSTGKKIQTLNAS